MMRPITQFFILLLLTFSQLALAQENTAALCADGIDNDGDGLVDCEDRDCSRLPNNGCATCTDGLSFADALIEYVPGCVLADPDPSGALGVSDYTGVQVDEPQFVFLGQGGFIKLAFTNNLLSNGGDNNADLWIFEVGPAVEACDIALRPANDFTEQQLINLNIPDGNGDGFYDAGRIAGSTSSIDIDAVLPGYAAGTLTFDAVEVRDVDDGACIGGTPGADIDAICALFSLPTDCAGVVDGTSEIDSCGVCLERDDPAFNQSCLDCNGTINGEALLDSCGVCLLPNDPSFNQSCADCRGVPNGEFMVDDCGQCLTPDDPAFNQSCDDCNGVRNGPAVTDDCGVCLDPANPTFNQSCADCAGTPNGAAVIDSCGQCLPQTSPVFNQSCADCAGVVSGTAVVDSCGVCLAEGSLEFNQSCLDCSGVPNGDAQVDDCGVCLSVTDPLFGESCPERYHIYIPTAFSPDNDGVNDRFEIYKHREMEAILVVYRIFDRWGGLVYEITDADMTSSTAWWAGLSDGRPSPAGVYVYYVEIDFANGRSATYSGAVNVVR